jgi:hypothetical protein
MIVLMVLLFRLALSRRLVDEAREHAELGVLGRMEGHAEIICRSTRTVRYGIGSSHEAHAHPH